MRASGVVPRWCNPQDTSDVVVSSPPATRFHMIPPTSESVSGRPPISQVTRVVVMSSDGFRRRNLANSRSSSHMSCQRPMAATCFGSVRS